jgi:hypothetical protein
MEEDIKVRQDKLHADWPKIDADRGKRRANMKAFNERWRERRLKEKPTKRRRWLSGKPTEKKKKKSRLQEEDGQEESRPRSDGKAGSHSRQDRHQPDEIETQNGTSREDGCQSKGYKGRQKTNSPIRAETKSIQAKADAD